MAYYDFIYDEDEWIYDEHIPLTPDEIRQEWLGHEHCAFCFNLNCQDDKCKVIKCNYCLMKFHECKQQDHEEICLMVLSPCLNANYGCDVVIRRDRLSKHLEKCSASIVVCNLQWNREIIGKQAKKRMKQVARGFKDRMVPGELKKINEDEFDILAALMDQNEILKSYKTIRKSRVIQRTACTPANPILPLRFYDYIKDYDELDSSDEEIFLEEQKRMKIKQPFSDCYICKLEPGMQHLHVLGGLGHTIDDSNVKMKNKQSLDDILRLIVPKFYQKRSLFVKLSEARMSDFHRKAFQYRWTREMHTFTCTDVMRRDEIKNHWDYHNTVLQQTDGIIIKRCPLYLEGCDFYVQQLIPKIGRIRFDDTINKFLFEPYYDQRNDVINEDDNDNKTELGKFKNAHVLRLLLPYLDTTTIRTLSSLNLTFNTLIKTLIKSRIMTLLQWKKDSNNKWIINGKYSTFSNIPCVMDLIPNVNANSQMINHISNCNYYQKLDHSRDKNLIKNFVNLAVIPSKNMINSRANFIEHR